MQKQKKNFNWKKTGLIAMWSALILVFFVSVGFTTSRMKEQHFEGIEATIVDSTGHSFVTATDLLQLVQSKYGDLKKRSHSSINTTLLESIILNNPFVASVKVFSTIDGKLHIEVKQRDPLVRVINFKHESFYIDGTGKFMPVSEKYTARVPVVNGYIFNGEAEQKVRLYSEQELEDTSVAVSRLSQVICVAKCINNSPFWKSQIVQIYVNANGDLELIPRVGDHTIIMGDARATEKKLNNLYHFYTEGLSKSGWRKYKTINIKYQDQIVCTKR
jgi:cell division protein FtsQ